LKRLGSCFTRFMAVNIHRGPHSTLLVASCRIIQA
jgi:hypothetical protein